MMKLWNFAAKVPNLESELLFLKAMGAYVVVDEVLHVDDRDFRVVLLRWGDKYMHLFENAVYEHRLDSPRQHGLCHVVFEVDDVDELREAALQAGAREIMPKSFISAGFGTRDVVFLRSPGGVLFELIKVREHRVPELP
jgi:catechol 2,3-dioxygenase-like lactoylglutathione lyase family enzyme